MLDELGTIENGIFKFVVEVQCAMRATGHAEHAVHALAVVVNVVLENLLFLALFGFHHFGFDDDGVVGAHHLTNTATHTLVLVEFVVRKDELATKAVEHLVLLAVFGIALGDFRSPEFAHGHFQTGAQTLNSSYQACEIIVLFHNFFVF